jgi:dTDP-D-glucose 4,6-dehydratase
LGLVQPELRELVEMRFQTDRPYRVDASKYLARFAQPPTSFEEGLAATVRLYRAAMIG